MNNAMAGSTAILPFDTETDPSSMGTRRFHHRKVTPLWPQANAAERFMHTIGKIVRIAPMQGMP